MELTSTNRLPVESVSIELSEAPIPELYDRSFSKELRFKSPSGDIVVARVSMVNSALEDSFREKSSEVDLQPEDLQKARSSRAKSPRVNSPPKDSSKAKSSKANSSPKDSTKAKSSRSRSPKVNSPPEELPGAELSKVDLLSEDSPEVKSSEVELPSEDSSKPESPKVDLASEDLPKPESPKVSSQSEDLLKADLWQFSPQPEKSSGAKMPNVDLKPEESSQAELPKVSSQPEDSSKIKVPKLEVAEKKSPKSDPVPEQKKNRNWKFLAIAIGILSMATVGSLAINMIFQSKAEVFKSPEKVSGLTMAQIDEVISSNVKLDEKVTLTYLRSKLTVSQFKSQDRQYTVFRIIAPETCGKLGCLYIVKAKEGMAIPLQLEDIGVGKEMFKSSPKFHCFNTVQRQNGEDRNFEICEQSY